MYKWRSYKRSLVRQILLNNLVWTSVFSLVTVWGIFILCPITCAIVIVVMWFLSSLIGINLLKKWEVKIPRKVYWLLIVSGFYGLLLSVYFATEYAKVFMDLLQQDESDPISILFYLLTHYNGVLSLVESKTPLKQAYLSVKTNKGTYVNFITGDYRQMEFANSSTKIIRVYGVVDASNKKALLRFVCLALENTIWHKYFACKGGQSDESEN